MDTWSLQNVSFIGHRSNCGSHSHQTSFAKTWGRSQLRTHALPPNHLMQTIIESHHGTHKLRHPALLDVLTSHQRSHVKDHLVDTNNRFNEIFPFFLPLHSELSPGLRIIDNFSNQFSFNLCNK